MGRTKILLSLTFITLLIIAIVVGLIASQNRQGTRSRADETAKPNIVFILTDDLDSSAMKYMPKTQNLLKEKGASFDNYFLSFPLCCPSRATTLRGQYAHNTKIYTNNNPDGGFGKFKDSGMENSTIATWLHDAGYKTGLIGKYLNNYGNIGGTYVPPGWDKWLSGVGGNQYDQYDFQYNEDGVIHSQSGRGSPNYFGNILKNKSLRFIEDSITENKPFFLYLSTYSPHGPANFDPKYNDMFNDLVAPRTPSFNEEDVSDKPQWIKDHQIQPQSVINNMNNQYRKRAKSLQTVDETVADIVSLLESKGKLNNTYIIFTSDNGFHFGNHRLRMGKTTIYEEDIHVPLYIRGPGITAQTKVDKLAGNVDLAPTFADMANVQRPDFVDGRSLLSVARGQNPESWRKFFLLENNPFVRANQTPDISDEGDEKLPPTERAYYSPPYAGLRLPNSVYAKFVKSGEREFYNLTQDPFELNNTAKNLESERISKLDEKITKLLTCQGQECRTIESQSLDGDDITVTPPPPKGDVTLNMKLSFQGINTVPPRGELMSVKVSLINESSNIKVDQTVQFDVHANGIWEGKATFSVPEKSGYYLLVKGPLHLQKRICDVTPRESSPGTYTCSTASIALKKGDNSLNFAQIKLLSGDLPNQDGVVDAFDISLIRNILSKSSDDRKKSENTALADINRDGIVDTQDYSLVIAALSVRADEN